MKAREALSSQEAAAQPGQDVFAAIQPAWPTPTPPLWHLLKKEASFQLSSSHMPVPLTSFEAIALDYPLLRPHKKERISQKEIKMPWGDGQPPK